MRLTGVRVMRLPAAERTVRVFVIVVVSILASLAGTSRADVESVLPSFYNEPGFHDKWRQKASTVNEHIDPFSGSLTLSHTDLVVPGAAGLDIRIQRHYSSNIWFSRGNPLSNPPIPNMLLPSGPSGVGWTMHFGRVIKAVGSDTGLDGLCETNAIVVGDTTLNNAVLELADGSQEALVVNRMFASSDGSNIVLFSTKKGWAANCLPGGDSLALYSPDGLRYTMAHRVAALDEATYTTRLNRAWYPTRIEDGNGNYLTISYAGQKGSHALISEIRGYDASGTEDGRLVTYGYTNGYVTSITANNQTWTYEYVDADTGHKLLTRVVRPDGLAWQYTYNPTSGVPGRRAMASVTYPYGATASYTYQYVDFVGNVAFIGGDSSQKYYSIAIATKTQGGRGIEPGTWTYTFAPGTDTTIEPSHYNDVTTIDFPGGRHIYRHYGMQRQLSILCCIAPRELWKTGLLREKEIQQVDPLAFPVSYVTVHKESYTWQAPGVISNELHPALPYEYVDLGVFFPQLVSKVIERDGTAYRTDYNYDCPLADGTPAWCIKPKYMIETGQQGTVAESTRRTDLYWYPFATRESATPGVWKFDQILHEVVDGNNSFGTLRVFDYATGNLTAIQPRGVYEGYTHHASGDVATKTNANSRVWQYNNHHRGVPRQEIHPVDPQTSYTITRTVNDTGTVASETNGRNYVTNYQYDAMNRPVLIDEPLGADTSVTHDATGRTVTRGSYRQRTEFDGFGRTVCVEALDTARAEPAVTIVTRFNVLGHKAFESQPFTGSCASSNTGVAGEAIETDVLGRPRRITHPDNTTQQFRYLADNRTEVTNERSQVTTYTYRSYGDPDKAEDKVVMRIDAPENVSTVFQRNVIGQIVNVSQGTRGAGVPLTDGVTRSYTYDPTYNFLLTATNPETGTTVYTRDYVGNMLSRQVGDSGVTNYYYDRLNRLNYIDYPGTQPDVSLAYDANSNLKQVYSNMPVAPTSGIEFEITRSYNYDANDNLQDESLGVLGLLYLGSIPDIYESRSFITRYGYNTLDQLQSITYPSGRVVNFGPDALGRARQVSPFVTAVDYHPNGQPATINYANGRSTSFALNNRQWTERISTTGGLVDLTYNYDGRGNVRSISDGVDPQNNRALDYDGIDRLTQANGSWGAGSFGYDTVGNLRSQALGAASLSYTYDASNRLASVTGSQLYNFTYDSYGNVVSNNRHLFNYDDAGNLTGVSGDSTAVYLYDGKNLRVREGVGSTVRYHFYAKNGSLLGEYNRDTVEYKEYAYLGGKLVAMAAEIFNNSPVVNAGADQVVGGSVPVTLTGTASDPDGTIVSYLWAQTAGPAVTLSGAATATASFVAPQVASNTTLTFSLTVTDNLGATAVDTVDVVVSTLLPPPVTTLMAFPGSGQVQLTWQPVQGPPEGGAVSYNLYWSTIPGVTKLTGNRISGVTSPYSHTGLTNGTTYYYIITAQNSQGESVGSAQVTVAPNVNGWVTPGLLESSDMNVSTSTLAMSADGRSVTMWKQQDGTNANATWISTYQPGSGWTAPALTTGSSPLGGIAARIINDGSVHGISAWNSGGALYASRYSSASGWTTPVAISTVNTDSRTIHESAMDVDSNGNIVVAWREFCCNGYGYYYIFASRYSVATGTWSAPQTLAYGGVSAPERPQVRLNASGDGVVVWTKRNLEQGIAAAVYSASTNTWSPPGTYLSYTSTNGQSFRPSVAISANGTAVVVYQESSDQFMYARRYVPGSGWGAAIALAGSGYGQNPSAAMDDFGSAVVTWDRFGAANREIYAIHFSPTAGWSSSAIQIGRADQSYYSGSSRAAMYSNGNSVAAWSSNGEIWANRYLSATGWGVPVRVSESPSLYPSMLTVDTTGNAIILCTTSGYTYDLYIAHYMWFGASAPNQNAQPSALAVYSPRGGSRPAEGEVVTLDGSGSVDFDGNIAAYEWSQVSGPAVTLMNVNSAQATFVAPQVDFSTTLIFQLKVTDNQGASSTDKVDVPVYDVSPQNASGVTAKSGIRSNTLTWSGASALSNVYWSTTPGVTPTTGSRISGVKSPFVHSDLTPGATYYYVVTQLGIDGQESSPSIEVNAKVLDSAWDVPAGFGTNVRAVYPRISLDGNGNVMSVWENCCMPQGIFANRYLSSGGWGTAQMISTTPTGSVPRVASDSSGNGWAVWLQNDGTRVSVYANRYTVASGWETPILLENDSTTNANDLVVTGNGSGGVMALWNQVGLQVARYGSGGWEAPQTIGNTWWGYGSSIAMDAAGNAIATWESDISLPGRRIFARKYTAGVGWEPTTQLETYSTGNSYTVNAAMSLNGNAVVAWYRYNTQDGYKVYASRYLPGTGWTAAESLGEPGTWVSTLVDDNGNALVAWYWNYSYWSKRYLASQGWGSHELVGDLASDQRLSMALDLNGTANAAWGYDTVKLGRTTLASASANNTAPIANPGANQAVNEYATVTLDGSASTDAQGTIASHFWRQTAGPQVSLNNPNTAVATFVAPEVSADTVYTFELTVMDYHGATSRATTSVTVLNVNATPVANAGVDRSVGEGSTVYLDGTASSDSDGSIATYKWTQLSGIPVAVLNSTMATANFVAPLVSSPATLVFELKVTDNLGGSSTARVTVTVVRNQPPTANTGAPQTVNEGSVVTLTGAGNDTDGTVVSYAWSYIWDPEVDPPVTLATPNAASTTFIAPQVAADKVLTFQLTVTDNLGSTAKATTTVTVRNTNQSPTANAGTAQTVSSGSTVTLAGSGTDPDGAIASYNWIQTDGPAVTLNNANTATASFTAPTVTADTILSFQLTVTDNNGATGSAGVDVTVQPAPITGRDLVMSSVSATPVQIARGQSLTIANTVRNQGTTGVTSSFSVRIYLSPDAAITTADTVLATRTVSSLAAGVSNTINTAATVPTSVAAGTYYIGAIADYANSQSESNENNNALAGNTIEVLNNPPTVNAGTAQTVNQGVTVNLSGSATDTDGTIASYQWTQTGGPSVTLSNVNTATASFVSPSVTADTVLTFQLTATDNDGASVSASTTVTVRAVAQNTPPTVSVGANQTVNEATLVTLAGTASDADGTIASYAWTQTAGPTVTLNNANTATANFLAPTVTGSTVFSFRLTVTDDQGASASATTNVTVNNVSVSGVDLVVTALTASASRVNPGQTITVTNRAMNQGTTSVTSSFSVRLYRSTDATITTSDSTLATRSISSLSAGAINTANTSVTIPSSLAAGTYYLGAIVDYNNVISESNNNNNSRTGPTFTVNAAPTANAGASQTVTEGDTVTLTGTGNDSDGTIVSYAWTQTAGPTATINNASSATATFVTPVVTANTTLTFQLTVTDNEGRTGSATTNVTVNNVNQPPTANAGTDRPVGRGTAVTLAGSGSDPDGTIASYAWTQTAGPAVTLANANTATASFTAPIVTTDTLLTFRLTVTDNAGATGSATVNITVLSANTVPTVNAGANQSVNEGSAVTLAGSATDPDGTIASYQWIQTAGPAVTLTNATSATASFTAPQVTADTVLTFQFTVTDNNGANNSASTNVTVRNVLPFPQVTSVTASTFGSNTTSHAVAMPSSVSAGDLLLMLVASDGSASQTTPTGWTALFLNQRSNSVVTFSGYIKVATGSEGGTTVNVVTSATEQAAAQVYRITGWYGSLSGVTSSSSSTGASTTPNSPSLTPSWGTANTLWLSVHAADHDTTRSVSAYPSNYTGGQFTQSNTGSSAVHVASAWRTLSASSENPGSFTMSGSDDWVAKTIAIRPAP